MDYLRLILKISIEDFLKNKLRTLLTSLGIFIGVLSVLLLNSLGLGLRRYLNNQFESLGSNLLYIYPGSKKGIFKGSGFVGGIKFDERDLRQLKKIKEIKTFTPNIVKTGAIVEAGGKEEVVDLLGVNEAIIEIFNLTVSSGRAIEKKDLNKKTKSAMISEVLAEKLFKSKQVVNEIMTVEGNQFKIIGVLKAKGGGGLGSDLDSHVYVPLTTLSIITGEKKYPFIYLKAIDKEKVELVKEKITKIFKERYDKDSFSVLDQKETMGIVDSVFRVLNFVLIAIAGISLIVGGVGIMNIMYVSVSERIREIGIRRAFGARENDILWQFLAEAIILSLSGGLSALLVSYLLLFPINYFLPAYLDFFSIILALSVSSIIGIIFGVMPAKKAARLDPVEAIRYE